MEAIHRITRVTATKWTWLWHCWRLRKHVIALAQALEKSLTRPELDVLRSELRSERDAKHLVELELKALKEKLEHQVSEFKVARDGNQALLRFIHTRHRLNIKFDPNTIRAALQNADRNGGKR